MTIFQYLIHCFDDAAEKHLPLTTPLSEEVITWAEMHGWDAADIACQRIIIRQALLNAAARQLLAKSASGISGGNPFVTSLDTLRIDAPSSLIQAVDKAAQPSCETPLNFWGDLYTALIPQAQRRRIGQFWTQGQVADWMVAWLCQSNPLCLADIGCGAGNFLLKAAQRLEQTGGRTALYGCDISPLIANLALAAFRAQPVHKAANRLTLEVQDYLTASLPTNVDAVVCNPPYTRHHHIPPLVKDSLYAFFKTRLHLGMPRQATLALYFLLKIIAEIPDGARGDNRPDGSLRCPLWPRGQTHSCAIHLALRHRAFCPANECVS